MTEQQQNLLKALPPRERFILAGLGDPTYQPTDMEKVKQTKARADLLNDKYNEKVAKEGTRTPYFATPEIAGQDSISFLAQHGMPEENIQRAQNWLAQYNPTDTSGFDTLMTEFSDECGPTKDQKADAYQILSSLNMTKEELISFKNAYVANIMTQLVGGLIKEKDDKTSQINCTGDASIVIGLPGAGKSTTIKEIKDATGAFHIDADAIKGVVAKTFGVSINALGMHQLSSYIRNELVACAQRERVNLIIEKIGDKESSIIKAGNGLAQEGYTVGLSLVHVKNSRSQSNNEARAEKACEKIERQFADGTSLEKMEAPRMVEPSSIEEFQDGPLQTYLNIMANRENSPFSVFSACCNETTYLGKDTAPAIKLYGISDENAPAYEDKDKAIKGFQKIAETTKTLCYEYCVEMIKVGEGSEEFKQTELAQLESLSKGTELPDISNLPEDMQTKLSSSRMMYVAMVNALLQEVYNPENATKDNDIRTLLENDPSKIKETLSKMMSRESVAIRIQKLTEELIKQDILHQEVVSTNNPHSTHDDDMASSM